MKISSLSFCIACYSVALSGYTGSAAYVPPSNISPPLIDVVGPRTQNGVVCLPNSFSLQDLDPMRPKSVPTYSLPEFDESGYIGPTEKIDDDMIELMNTLTLEEKVGQMFQVHAGMLLGCDGLLNITAAEEWFDKWKIGSFLETFANQGGRWDISSPQRWANLTNTIQQLALTRGSKIPIIWGLDSIRGANYIKGATMFGTPHSVAASFNREHAYVCGKVTAKDTRAAGVQWAFAPVADLNVNKLWSRNFENFGEDPYLASEMVKNSVKGFQGNYKKDRTRVAASIKHFFAYGAPVNGKDQEPRSIPMNELLEFYAPAFEAAFGAGAATVMEAYGTLNGQEVVSSRNILRDLLRDRMGFHGMMVTDWGEINAQYYKHRTAFSVSDAVFQSMNNTSIDMSMVASDTSFAESLIGLVKNGSIPMSRIDESVGRLLQLKKDLGLFEQPYSDLSLIDTVGSAQDVEASRQAARESLVLLKNEEDFLPLKPEEKVLFIGPNINSTRFMSGGWNIHWQGPSDLEGDVVYDGYGDTILLGVEKVTGNKVNWVTGYDIDGKMKDNYDVVVRMARKADKVIFGFGERTTTEIPGDINTLNLPKDQYKLVERVALETKTPFALLLVQNRPFILGELSGYADAILNCNLPGPYGGLPIAEALYGKFSPSGRMPYTYPKMEYQNRVTYFTPIWNEYDPEFAFGTGFGYNNITYSDVTVSSKDLYKGKPINVSITATNVGSLPQLEPVIMYTTQLIRREYVPERLRLRAFDKKLINPGQSVSFDFTLSAEEMMFWNVDLERILAEGPVNITINAGNENAKVTTINLHE
ncbi:hypothetical protein BB560_001481 [Smittium megazygosporum]|uniref:beta-glucosidase n=1 Tax=Smittium megazygosporum TaxID=133381 RepID=A0A2T9ZHE2_9FUNG|nr:hypothetical protein BB560_001481 [Smittium megazygosporum]